MITLCTDRPSIRHEGERIIATIPSGKTDFEIALSYAQATSLGETMVRVVREAIRSDNIAASGEIVAFVPKQGGERPC